MRPKQDTADTLQPIDDGSVHARNWLGQTRTQARTTAGAACRQSFRTLFCARQRLQRVPRGTGGRRRGVVMRYLDQSTRDEAAMGEPQWKSEPAEPVCNLWQDTEAIL